METPTRNDLVVKAWNEGQTGGRIAATLGITRNTVMGILSRQRDKGTPLRLGRVAPAVLTVAERLDRRKNYKAGPGRPRNDGKGQKVITLPVIKAQPLRKVKPLTELAQPSDGLWVTFPEMGVKNCRFTSDAKHFCNRPGYPYCPDHMAVIRLPYVRKSRGVDLFGPSKALVGRNFG